MLKALFLPNTFPINPNPDPYLLIKSNILINELILKIKFDILLAG